MFELYAQMQPRSLLLAVAFALVVTALYYLRGWLYLRNALPNLIPVWRLVAFLCGLVSVWTAVASPLATLDHQSLTIHMVKHLLLMTVAAPLVLAGAPVVVLQSWMSRCFIENNVPLGSLPTGSIERCLTHPVLCWLVGTSAVIGWHLPIAFELAMQSHWIHDAEDGCFLLAGLLFWWPVLRPSSSGAAPRWSMALYLFLATLPCDLLSAFLAFCDRPVYPCYLSTTQLFSLSPLQDQQCAGALMWVWVTFAYLIPAVAITMQILSPPNQRSHKPAQLAWRNLAAQPLNGSEAEVI
jgi:putative membrane protein